MKISVEYRLNIVTRFFTQTCDVYGLDNDARLAAFMLIGRDLANQGRLRSPEELSAAVDNVLKELKEKEDV